MTFKHALILAVLATVPACSLFDQAEPIVVVSPDAGTSDAGAADLGQADPDLGIDAATGSEDAGDGGEDAGDYDPMLDEWDPVVYYSFDQIVDGAFRPESRRGVTRDCLIDGDVTETEGLRGGAAQFGGGTCWIAHESPWELGEGTIVVWVRSNFEESSKTFLSKGASDSIGFLLANAGGYYISILRGSPDDQRVVSGSPLELGRWYTLAFTWDAERTSVWIDGDVAQSELIPFSLVGNTEILTIGANSTSSEPGERLPNYNPFDGTIDELWVFDRVLTTVEMQDLIRQTRP